MLDKIWLHKQSWTNINQNLISVSYLHRSHLTNSNDSYDPDEESTIIFIFSNGGCTIYSMGKRLHIMNSLQQDCDTCHPWPWQVFHMYFSLVALHLGLFKASYLPPGYVTSHRKLFSSFHSKVHLAGKKVQFRDAVWRTEGVMEIVIDCFNIFYKPLCNLINSSME